LILANNIELLKNYVDKDGKDIVVIYYENGKYLCYSSDNKKLYLTKDEIFEKKNKVKIVEPDYFEEQVFDFSEEYSLSLGDVLFEPPEEEGEMVEEKIEEKEAEPQEEDDFFKHFM